MKVVNSLTAHSGDVAGPGRRFYGTHSIFYILPYDQKKPSKLLRGKAKRFNELAN